MFAWSQLASRAAALKGPSSRLEPGAKREQPRRPVRKQPPGQKGAPKGPAAAATQPDAGGAAPHKGPPKMSKSTAAEALVSVASLALPQPAAVQLTGPVHGTQDVVAAAAPAGLEPAAAPAPARTAAASASRSGSTGAAKATLAAAAAGAAVPDSNKFLLPITSTRPSGKGFFGTWDTWTPDAALAVGPHPTDADVNYVLHCVNSVCEIFFATKGGQRVHQEGPSKVYMRDMMAAAGYDISNLDATDPSAWYDPAAKRYVVLWTSEVLDPVGQRVPGSTPLYVAVSQGNNPLGKWAVWALESRPAVSPGLAFCKGVPGAWYLADYPQASYSQDGVFVAVGAVCIDSATGEDGDYLSAMFAFSKEALYAAPPAGGPAPKIFAASYLAAASWFFSVPAAQRGQVADAYKPFNNHMQPAWPQAAEDVARPPLFVMKVDNARLSIATLTDEPLGKMTSADTAPKLLAAVGGKGADFSNKPGQPPGEPVMHQPDTEGLLDAGDVGMMDSLYGVFSYHSVQHKGRLYATMLEYWGKGAASQPSVYWGIFDVPTRDLCRVRREDWGVVASRDGLAVSYPVIGARGKGGALLAYAYSGATEALPNNQGPAYAGVATTVVGVGPYDGGAPPGAEGISLVKAGSTDIVDPDIRVVRYGDYSAAAFVGGDMWFAVLTANPVPGGASLPRYTWISVARL